MTDAQGRADAHHIRTEQAARADYNSLDAQRTASQDRYKSDVAAYDGVLAKHNAYNDREAERTKWDDAKKKVNKYDKAVDAAKKYNKYLTDLDTHNTEQKKEDARKEKWTTDSNQWKSDKQAEETRYASDMKKANDDYTAAKSTYDTKLDDAKTLHQKNADAQ